ncbi:MAG: tripartite tricarboxylate transporter substrate binding protein [Rhodospirillales bacterium]|nr:tripartite tricarboxylate transporter substrate binding protein [Rhodospirillales bacterium]
MPGHRIPRRDVLGTAAAFFMSAASARAQQAAWPARPVKILVGFPPGGGADAIARVIAKWLSERWGQPVVVDNKPGASTMIASEVVARSAPDGYTLLLAVSNHTSNPALFSRVPYDTRRDFTPIIMIGAAPAVLVVNPGLPAKSMPELLALLRAKPGKLTYGSAGNGSIGHFAGEMLKQKAGVDMVHVPYKGTAPAETDLMGGFVDLMFTGTVTALPQIKAGRMRGIAVGSRKRLAVLPDLPTVDEAGVPGFESGIWYGLLGPAGLPTAITEKINHDVMKALQENEVSSQLLTLGAAPIGNTPAEFARQIEEEIVSFEKLVKAAGISGE